jgi:hypothetical protein
VPAACHVGSSRMQRKVNLSRLLPCVLFFSAYTAELGTQLTVDRQHVNVCCTVAGLHFSRQPAEVQRQVLSIFCPPIDDPSVKVLPCMLLRVGPLE